MNETALKNLLAAVKSGGAQTLIPGRHAVPALPAP